MWRRREHAPDAWSRRLRDHGRVELPIRRWLAALLAGFHLLLGVGGAAGLVLGPDSTFGAVVLGLLAVFGFAMGALMGRVATRAGPALVVDAHGIHLPGLAVALPWRAVRGVKVVRLRLSPILYVELDRRFKDEMLRDSPTVWRHVHALDDTVTLPSPIAADVDDVADWLGREARERS